MCARCEITDTAQHDRHMWIQKRQEQDKNYHPPGGRYWTASRVFPDWPADKDPDDD